MVVVQKRKIWWAISLFLVMLYFSGLTVHPSQQSCYGELTQAQYGGGTGEPSDPYLIYSAEQMNTIGLHEEDWDKHFKLMEDIDLSSYTGTDFNIIGYFSGVFDGNGKKISNLSYTSDAESGYVGLFRSVGSEGEIKDLGLIDPNVNGVCFVGSLVGYVGYRSVITNCYAEDGSISGERNVGGLVGSSGGTITNCYSSSNVSGDERVGGLVGALDWGGATITNCYSTGSVSGNRWVGGLVGYNRRTITNCYSVGSVSGDELVGGLVGSNSGTITNCFWDIETSGQTTSDGGKGKTTAEMQMESTFLGWGGCWLVWMIDEGANYPKLAWENMPGQMLKTPSFPTVAGSGTESDPYLIHTAEQLNAIGLFLCEWDKHFKLMGDIDLSGYKGTDFNIIGYYVKRNSPDNKPFTGVFDGNGKKISNFSYTSTDRNDIGLFGHVSGHIKDLGLINPNVDAGTGYRVGSLVGRLKEGTINNCYAEGANVAGHDWVGGLVGWNSYGTISNCYSAGSVTGIDNVGGLVGDNGGTITNCYSSGEVSGNWRVGGLVGWNSYGTITNCYATGSVAGHNFVGGLVGFNNGSITNSHSTGTVNGNYSVGGLVGGNGEYSYITNCYSVGSVSGQACVGGLVGYNSPGTITNCYSTGSVTGHNSVGGLVGWNSSNGTIINCYSIGSVSGDYYVSGLVGDNRGEVTDSFWDTQTSGQIISDGGTGKTTAEMQTKSTFTDAGWDFVGESVNGTEDIWWILEGREYPRLWCEFLAFSPDPPNGAVDVIQPLILSWVAGGSDLHHDIYLGEDEQVVADATTENPVIYRGRQPGEMTTYDPGTLELGKTYYWRIDEYNTDVRISKGNVWSFTTANFLVVDDFDDYNDYPGHRIYETWTDGWQNPNNGASIGYPGYPEPLPVGGYMDILEPTDVHGGEQWLPFFYDNTTAVYSEVSVNTADLPIGSDWTKHGVKSLSLWFYGDPSNSAEPMYVKLNGVKVPYDGEAGSLLRKEWQPWNINLSDFTGVDLSNVTELGIGFERGAGGYGKVLFDDIRLYRPAPAQ